MSEDERVMYTEFIFEDEEPEPVIRAPKKTKRLLFVRDMNYTPSKIHRNYMCTSTDRIPRENLDKIREFIDTCDPPTDLILISSPLARAENTAKFIHQHFFKTNPNLAHPNKRVKYHDYFREIKTHPGDFFEGEEIIKDTRETFGERQKAAFEYLTHVVKENNIIIVTHEKFMSQLTQTPHGPGDCVQLDFDIF